MSKKKASKKAASKKDDSKDTVRLSPAEIAALLKSQGVEEGDLEDEFSGDDDE